MATFVDKDFRSYAAAENEAGFKGLIGNINLTNIQFSYAQRECAEVYLYYPTPSPEALFPSPLRHQKSYS